MENPKMEMTVERMHSITRSYSRKINLSNHVPNRDYESIDLFSSHSEQIPKDDATEATCAELSEHLYKLARADVEDTATRLINDLKREQGVPVDPVGDEYKQIADIIIMLNSAVNSEEVRQAVDAIKERKDKLNETQLEYLRTITRNAEARTLR